MYKRQVIRQKTHRVTYIKITRPRARARAHTHTQFDVTCFKIIEIQHMRIMAGSLHFFLLHCNNVSKKSYELVSSPPPSPQEQILVTPLIWWMVFSATFLRSSNILPTYLIINQIYNICLCVLFSCKFSTQCVLLFYLVDGFIYFSDGYYVIIS